MPRTRKRVRVKQKAKNHNYSPLKDATALGIELTPEQLAKYKRLGYDPKPRTCLTCNTIFNSSGPGHRRCPNCSEKIDNSYISRFEEREIVCHAVDKGNIPNPYRTTR